MFKRILSTFLLIALMAGITVYGYQYQFRTTFASASTEAASISEDAALPDADPEEITEDTGTDGSSKGQADAAPDTDGFSQTEAADVTPEQEISEESATDADDPDETGGDAALLSKGAESPAVDMSRVTIFPEPRIMYVQTSVNVRKGPDTSFDKIGSVKTNEELTILGQYENDGWYHFLYHGEEAFISNLYVADTMVEPPEPAPESASADTEQPAQTADPKQAAAPAPEPAPQPVAAAGVLFIGDSRCVQMKEAVGGGSCSWICENSKGYNWLVETALPRADSSIGKGTKVVICLGVNDTRNCNNYAAIMNQKAAEWAARGARTYYVSVNPVWENPYTSEEQVETFNASIVGQLSGITWIDTHSWLINNGYRLVDGLHYDSNTYVNIFNVIVGSL